MKPLFERIVTALVLTLGASVVAAAGFVLGSVVWAVIKVIGA